jgi:hypothetical protein
MFNLEQPSHNPYITYTTVPGQRPFSTQKELSTLADALRLSRVQLEAIWNGLAGKKPYEELKPVKKFRNRPYGVKQIWKVIQRLIPKKPSRGKKIPVPAHGQSETTGNQKVTKSTKVIGLMMRKDGASSIDLMMETGWKSHTVRGFISTLQSKHGLKINGTREEGRGMVYRIA